MDTPIYDFVKTYADSHTVRAHMPGHKGISPFADEFAAVCPLDITEIYGADSLFESDGIIARSERNAAKLFGCMETIYSAGGSTACIQAMTAAVCRPGDTIAAVRNCHRAFINACALLDLEVEWIFPQSGDPVSGKITSGSVLNAIRKSRPKALYITSPDYYGQMCDVGSLADICRSEKIYLLCDNAHGAYTAFLSPSLHPCALGADMCCDSAHKTLPVLTGGAYLHTNNAALTGTAKEKMSLFCSTSPSYLIMQSLDLCNKYLAERFPYELRSTAERIRKLKSGLSHKWEILPTEPLKLTLHTASKGITGKALSAYLRENGIECEFADNEYLVMMLSPQNTESDFERIEKVLCSFETISPPYSAEPVITPTKPPEKKMSIRQAVLSESEFIPAEEITRAVGRICGSTVTCCPPCVAAAVPGEIITEETARSVIKCGLRGVNAVKEKTL